MTHTLSITDGTTTVSLTTGLQYLSKYIPDTSAHGEDVREVVTVGFTGATLDDAISTLRSINQLLEQAYRWDKYKTGAKVYVNFEPGGAGTNVFRALLRDGSINMNARTLKEHWGARNLELEIEWTRQGYWEGAEVTLTLSSRVETFTTVEVGNKSDTDTGNYVQIASTDITLGDLPSPMKLTVANESTGAGGNIVDLYVFHNVDSGPASLVTTIEAESSSNLIPTTDTISSNYAYCVLTTSAAYAETLVARWPISAEQVTLAAGGRFALLTVKPFTFASTDATPGVYYRFKINSSLYSYMYSGIQTAVEAFTVVDTVRIPQSLQGQSDIDFVYLELWMTGGTTDNRFPLDYVGLAPISADSGWLKLSCEIGMAVGEAFVYNEYDDFAYQLLASGKKMASLGVSGGPILLVPNKTQRLNFYAIQSGDSLRAQHKFDVSISYRPRYRNI